MTPETIVTPPSSTPVVDELGNHGRPWFLYFTAVTRRLGVLRDAVMGWTRLTNVGSIPKVLEPGTVTESALSDDGTSITAAEREYKLTFPLGTRPGRLHMPSDGHVLLSSNLRFNGTDWVSDDTTQPSYMLNLNGSTLYFFTAVAGANPRTASLVEAFHINSSGHYYLAGIKVLGPQMAAVASPVINTANTALTADAVYDANEAAMLNELKTAVTNMGSSITALKTAVDGIRGVLSAALGGHGLTT